METLLVTYDGIFPGENRERLLDMIRRYPSARLSDSAYVISTGETADQVFEKLNRYAGAQGSLYVVGLSPPWKGMGPHYVQQLFNNWLPG